MKTKFLTLTAMVVAAFVSVVPSAQAQMGITLSGSSYTQNFDDIGGFLPDGWYTMTNASQFSAGTMIAWQQTNFDPSSNYWANTSGKFGNHASVGTFAGTETNDLQAAATDRALAVRQTSNFGDPGAAFVLKLNNTLGFGSFVMDADCLQLSPQDRETTWTVDYALGENPGFFIPVLKYTNSSTAFGKTAVNIPFGTALNNQSSAVWIRIAALNGSAGSGSRDTFGIDNFSLTYAADTAVTPISIVIDPVSRTNNPGTTAYFNVGATGTDPQYQWLKGTAELADDGHCNGVNTPSLQILNVTTADAGAYSCRVSNSQGPQTSQSAILTVPDLAAQNPAPLAKTMMKGDAVNILLNVSGTAPVTVQWRKNGVNIPGAVTNFTDQATTYAARYLAIADADGTHTYDAVVSNNLGQVDSLDSVFTVISMPTYLFTRWDFNAITAGETAPVPSSGSGSASVLGVTTTAPSGTFSDPATITGGLNYAWSTTGYPAQGGGNLTEGVQFNVSTVGYQDIVVAWEQRHSSTASRYLRFQYTTDGVNWLNGPVITITNIDFALQKVDLSSISGANNNASFAFRILAEWESTAINSGTAGFVGTTGTYAVNGTVRYDLITVAGNTYVAQPDPIPLTITKNGDGSITLNWSNPAFKLQERSSLSTGSWTTLEAATTGYTVSATGSKFYRLIAQP